MKDIQVTSFSVPASAFDPVVDVKQLRLGNWLQSFIIFNDGMGTISKKCISPFRVDLKTMEMLSDSQGKLFATMEPIAITPEILEKAGFKKFVFYAFTLIDKEVGNFVLRLKIKKDIHTFLLVGDGGHDESGEMDITDTCKYVHQLQNIFAAFTGEELEINLLA